ncbi:MAG TPA: M28 family peptidase [Blastocatellia bacterium]|nr:M28 family peptidase [Blastocatellia bacterium]
MPKPYSPMPPRRLLVALLAITLFLPTALGQQGSAVAHKATALTSAEREAAARVDVKTIREVTTTLAAKEMEGRGTAQPGADKAAKYLADRFAKIGLKPLGDANTYLQAIKFKVEQVNADSSFKVGDTAFKFKDDFVVAPPLPTEPKDVSAGLVFAGYGVASQALKRDDLAGIDIKGKIVVVLGGRPKDVDAAAWAKNASQQAVFGNLVGKGAVGFIIIYAGRDTQPYPLVAAYLTRRRVSLADAPQLPFKLPPFLLVSDSAAEKLFAGTGITYEQARQKAAAGEFVSRDLGKQAAISVRVRREEGMSSNVVGLLEGADAALKEQAVVYSAHYDAYGIEADGTIYPGAADNALGVAKIVAIAEALAKAKPRRSIIFLALTGEEYGLLGAEYWVRRPTWALEKVAANINYDGIGTDVWGPLNFLIDYGFEHSDLGALIKDVAAANGVTIIPDPDPAERIFYRSDHYAFFKKGIPALYLIGGPAGDPAATMERARKWLVTDYHMTTDTVQPDWNWEGARTLTVIGLIAGMRVANQEAMPAWLPSSPYNRPRGANSPPPAQ